MDDIDRSSTNNMSMIDKIAHFVVLVGPDSATKIFQHLPKGHVEEISKKIATITSIDRDTSLAILDEFHLYTRSKQYISTGGFDFAKDILYKSLGRGDADGVLDKLSRLNMQNQSFAYLDGINTKQLAGFIKDESPQTIAIVISHMESNEAAEVLDNFDDDLKVKVAMQMASIKDVSPDVIKTISDVLETKLEALTSSIVDVGGVKSVADMLNRIGPKSKDILKNINLIDTTMATQIKENMFVFEDLIDLEIDAIQKILQQVDSEVVAKALKNVTEEDMDKIKSGMSQRAQVRFEEEFEMLVKVKIKDVEAAQKQMLEVAQKLIDEGVIDRDNDEE
jgi:flagellar motor switch protein FliG